jgi:F0F1-type ATP synthase epsilon subunit
MQTANKSIVELFAEKAKVEAEIRKFRAKRIYAQAAIELDRSGHNSHQEKLIEKLNHELSKIHRCYIVIDDLIDQLECSFDLGED